MDYNVIATENWINDQMDANEAACYECAITVNGLTKEQADNCDCGHWNCCGCPWGGSEYVLDAHKEAL